MNDIGLKQMIGDKALVKLLPIATHTSGGILLPEMMVNNQLSQLATVVMLGDGRMPDGEEQFWDVEPGMTVALAEWANRPLKWQGVEYHLIYEHEILCEIEGLTGDMLA